MFATTTLSPNGQVVIPAEIRRVAKLQPKTQFIVHAKGDTILLKRLDEEEMDAQLYESLRKAEEDVRKGNVIYADTNMSVEEIDKLICESDLRTDTQEK